MGSVLAARARPYVHLSRQAQEPQGDGGRVSPPNAPSPTEASRVRGGLPAQGDNLRLARRGAVALGLTRGQDPIRDRLRLLEAGPVDEQADAPLPDLAEEPRVLVPPHDPGLLELARDGLGVVVGEGAEVDRVDVVAHGTSTAGRQPRTQLTSAISPARRSSSTVTHRSISRPSRSRTVRQVPGRSPASIGGVTQTPSTRTARFAIVDSVTSPRSLTSTTSPTSGRRSRRRQ